MDDPRTNLTGGAGNGFETNPYRVVRFKNTTPFVLEPGPISIYASGSFVGEGLSETVGTQTSATIPFAVESNIFVTNTSDSPGEELRLAKIVRGVLEVESFARRVTTWQVRLQKKSEPITVFVRQSRAWPWREMRPTTGVLARLAALHTTTSQGAQAISAAWDYEFTLADQAALTLAAFERAIRTPELSHLRAYGPALRRVVAGLPELRRELLELQPFGKVLLHGDVHSSNVVLRAKSGTEQAVFIDWGRARVGSPLEDVSSWLESLGCWEHEVRRRHDTLLRGYLVARGLPSTLERTLRDAYWLASASNSLSGALHYHLLIAMDETRGTDRERVTSAAAARAHLRVIRRADALWRA